MTKDPPQIAADLAQVVRGEVYADVIHRAAYSIDGSIYRIMPQCVVVPHGVEDVIEVMRYSAEEGIPVVARGAGSGLAGESLGSGIVLDMTCAMRRTLDVLAQGGRVTCEPGVVLEDLNRALARYGRVIGPDPSSANRATVGGCTANNATGAHSLYYGHVADHVWAVEAVLADGTFVDLLNNVRPDRARPERSNTLAARCLEVLSQNAAVIHQGVPKARRARIGYQVAGACHDGRVDMARLVSGSEGTLAVFTKVSLNTVALPPAKGLLQLEFDSLQRMAGAVPIIVQTGASACELMDRMLMDMAMAALPQYRDLWPEAVAAVLLVEQIGADADQVTEKLAATDKAVGDLACGRRLVSDPIEQRRLWKSRTDAVPLLYRRKGRTQPVPFIEDTCVDSTQLGRYIAALDQIGRRHGVALCYYGHAGDGELHVRPYLDLGTAEDVRKMRALAEEVFPLVWSLGGSISGEHAYGLVRAGFVRRQFGDAFVEVLRQIKQTFDPRGLLNPGKVLNDDPEVMTRHLRRSHAFIPQRTRSDLLFEPEEVALEVLQCNGCGLCRARGADQRMCPVFQALGEELASPRAKVNLLEMWATGQIDVPQFESPQFRQVLDLCIHCKACRQQCPSGVDVSKLMMAAKTEWARRRGLRGAERALANNRYLAMAGGVCAPMANAVLGTPVLRRMMEKVIGLDSRRPMPTLAQGSFMRRARRYLERLGPVADPIDRVVYLADVYVTGYDHSLGLDVLKVLRANRIEVVLPAQRPVPLPAITYGDVHLAKRDLAYLVRSLAPWVTKGYRIVCSEPSAAMALRDELRHFVEGPAAQGVSGHTAELMGYLLDLLEAGRLRPPNPCPAAEYLYHEPCHLMALNDRQASIRVLRDLCGAKVTDLKAGCCGLAGTYGMQAKNRSLSDRISKRMKEVLSCLGTGYVLTECSACKMQIESLGGSACQVQHPIQVLAHAYTGPGTDGIQRS